ncbi:MAG TPA: SpoIIE family protein phosphatase, partial [Blastocatellia bacterium]|nr:SpoIIE family protein phosphatase [Blastocatellia bacterium]
QIVSVDKNGPATALQVGDEVISINGRTLADDPKLLRYNEHAAPGSIYKMVVSREGQSLEFTLEMIRYPTSRWLRPIIDGLVQLLFLLTGLTVFLLKPADRQAWLLALMLGAFTGLFNNGLPPLPVAVLPMMAMARISGLFFLPVFCHFFLIFPDRSPLLRRFPNLERRLYWPFYLILPWFSFSRLVTILSGQERWARFFQDSWLLQQQWIGLLSMLIVLAYLAVGLLALFAGYRVAGVIARRKLHVVVVGSGAGVFNLLLVVLWETFFQTSYPDAYDWIRSGMGFTLQLIPLSFAYAIIRHQVIPVSLIIRRSVRYVLVSRGAILLDMIAVGLAVTAVLTYVFSRTKPPGIVIGLISATVGIVTWKIAGGLHDKYLRPLIDRRFFRQSYDAHQIIAELTGSLRTVTDLPQLLELVATRIQTALQPMNVTIFLRDQMTGNYNAAYSRDYNQTDSDSNNCRLNNAAIFIQQASDNGRPVDFDSIVELASDNGSSLIGPIFDELKILQKIQSTLLMPLFSKDGMLGIISLGPRLGDLPFSGEDKQLLMSVSGPAAFAIENARLVEQMVAEARRLQEIEVDHRRKTEELAFARQLQLSMLPASNVSLDNVEIIGRMRAATEVGGDYYDFIEMTGGRICVAVGDATGHGMAAGLVVGMVKMGLINGLQRMNGHAGVKPLIEDLNSALKRSLSQRGMGMCLGAAILDITALKIEIISNGMPAPYHYRAMSRSLTLIKTQAPPLGFLRKINVRPVEMRLEPGDALIWLSDGFEERMNHANQIWGSEQVERTLERVCVEEKSAEDIARRMIDACDGAAEGRSNEDDMTIVVAKIRS